MGTRWIRILSAVSLMTGLGTSAVFLIAGSRSWAMEAVSQEMPPPSSVEESLMPIELFFKEKPEGTGFFPLLKEELKEVPPFLRDTKLDFNLRTYYFYRDQFDGQTNEAWALGGALAYRSGLFLDRFSLGAVLYTSQPLHAPDDRDGTLLLKPDQEGYTVVGQIFGRVKLIDENFLQFYRSEYNTPFINKHDNRMTPNTFEGYTLQGTFGEKGGAPTLRYGAGYITKIKERNSDRFVWMSQDAGADVKRGVVLGGALFSYGRFSLGATNYYSNDIINIGYAETKYTLPVTDRWGVLFAAQFTDQRSVGDDLLRGSSFSTNQVGLRTEISYGGGLLALGYTRDSRGADLQSPWSNYPGYTAVQVLDFNRAGESAFVTKLSYDFTRVGLEGVTVYALFVHGWGRVDPSTKGPLPDENEFDADFQWRPKARFLKGLSLRVRYGVVHQYEKPRNYIHDFRVIANYDFSLF